MSKKIKGIANGQIFLIVLSIFAFAFIIGDVARVDAQLGPGGDGIPWRPGLEPVETGAAEAFNPLVQIQEGTLFAEAGGTASQMAVSHLASGAIYGAIAFFAGKMIAGMFGASESQSEAIGAALGVGVGLWKFLSLQAATGTTAAPAWISASGAFWAAAGVGLVVLLVMYKNEKMKVVEFQCLPWEAPLGGTQCEECNKDEFRACSEYRCKSLGQACEIVNAGSEEEKCVWVNPQDVTSPTIETWEEALTEGHSYVPHATRPADRGTRIVKDGSPDGCLQAFTPLEFGIINNEPAQCKVDIIHRENLEEMNFYMDDNNYFLYNHTQRMSLPSPNSVNAENPEISEDGIYDLYIRCQDKNGNENVDEFVVNFCVDPSPDTTPPIIEETSIVSGSPVSNGIDEVELDVFVNEPAECKWSVQDKNYDDMENEMSCASSFVEMNAEQLYPCSTTLTGVEDLVENVYYFRCKDNPNLPDEERNVNAQSYVFSLFGTQELSILEVAPNETITGNTGTIAVELYAKTDDGANEGTALCMFSPTGEEGSYVEMFETNSFEHRQLLTLTEGSYDYYFRCIDAGGNSDDDMTSFVVDVDNEAPVVTRAYHDIDALKIVTNEDAECVYSLNSCNYVFEEGIVMQNDFRFGDDRTNHITGWEENSAYYIKCKDDYNNQPAPNSCNIIVSASSVV